MSTVIESSGDTPPFQLRRASFKGEGAAVPPPEWFAAAIRPAPLPDALADGMDGRIQDLCRAQGVTSLEIFGSAALGTFDADSSDFDFIVRFAPDEERSLGRRFVALGEGLEALLGRPVDLMTDHPIENPYLRETVELSRRIVYVESTAQAPA
jgi:hypothetical protein